MIAIPKFYRESLAKANLAKLPVMCYARNPSDGRAVMIKRGVDGYFPCHGLEVELRNKELGVDEAQVQAMLTGSIFGWHVRAADPDFYRKLRR